ncbi:MAG: substrate-binding domain-containing protein, partial [Planctomycetes bacterium]|nr:substrate-binding domain-containing protein [Planctomycetota bacterium]
MLSKFSPALVVFFGSVALLAGLVGSLYWISRPQFGAGNAEPLEIHCAAAMFQVVETIAQEYTTTYGQQVVIHAGPSQVILKHLEEAKKADLFLPADDSFIRQADNKGLLGEVKNVASMSAVVIVRPKLGKEIKTWNDFLAAGQKIGLANTDTTAIGRLTRQTLQGQGLWQDLEAVKPTYLGDVNEVGNSVAVVGATDVGITWDALAKVLVEKNPDVKIVRLKELDHAKARVQIALA